MTLPKEPLPAPAAAPRVGIVSLGCPKALVDSERILTRLRAEGYGVAPDYQDADLVLVNTCGFLDSARAESFEAIAEAMAENGRVIVTGCMGGDSAAILERYPEVLAVTGPHQYEAVMAAVHAALPPAHAPFFDLVPPEGIRLTPRHYAYLKISEGCDHRCSFCIIPNLRGPLVSRPAADVLQEAERLAAAGVRELLIIAQDTGAYGMDCNHAVSLWRGRPVRAQMAELAAALGELGIWIRLHYVYPYDSVSDLVPLMAEGRILPYLDIPFQHASPAVLRRMRRPARQESLLEQMADWRRQCPALTLRSSFIVGFPGETEADFQYLLDWLDAAQLDRVGCFPYEAVSGAEANTLPDPVPEDEKQDRWNRLMAHQQAISAARLQTRIGQRMDVIIDSADSDGAVGRSPGDAPEIDGAVYLDGETDLDVGSIVPVLIDHAEEYDLWGTVIRDA